MTIFNDNYEQTETIKVYEIQQLGCGCSDNIIIEGEFIGTIWQDTCPSSGCIEFKSYSFFEYILNYE